MEENSQKQDEAGRGKPNDFPGHTYGQSQVIKVFNQDLDRGECAVRRCETSAGTFVLTLHTSKKQLFTLEGGSAGLLVGTGDVLSVDWYARYLLTFPTEVIKMMHDLFEEYKFTECNPMMVAVNGTFRVLPKGEGLSYLYFPDNTYFLVSDNIYDVLPAKVLVQNDNYWGYKISRWVRIQLDRLNKKHGRV